MNLACLGAENLAKFGEYVALHFEGRDLTNAEQERAASRIAHVLRRLGVAPGDRVVVMLPNCPEVIQSYGGILKAGAVIVPVIFLLGPEEVAHILAEEADWPMLYDPARLAANGVPAAAVIYADDMYVPRVHSGSPLVQPSPARKIKVVDLTARAAVTAPVRSDVATAPKGIGNSSTDRSA